MAMLVLLTLWGLYLFAGQLNANQLLLANARNGAAALGQAREAVIGDAISRLPVNDASYLRLPDLGFSPVGVLAEGFVSPNFAGNGKDSSVIGKFPWRTLGMAPLRDQRGECLWYVVSGRFQKAIKTDVLNWDTQGQISVMDSNGNVVATNLAALIVAPGRALEGQSHALADPAYAECGGNYDARQYLDAFNNGNAIAGQVNYFAGSINNRVAADGSSKIFVGAENDFYNDRFLIVTVDDIFTPLIRRADFRDAIGAMLDYFKGQNDAIKAQNDVIAAENVVRIQNGLEPLPLVAQVGVTGSKGVDGLDCGAAPDPAFCSNWKEMLLLTQLPAPAPIIIDGVASANCNRVLIFAGRKAAGQTRGTVAEKADKANYLEDQNASSFNVPVAVASVFRGRSVFDFRTPAADLLRCLL
ncbi:hypothetical protein [Accumulibacter sp.]|uniref:hypothetical protein n=1 Tax=Accumulibacter sp. TaxID=2053492 RepID=UPI00262B7B8E|nr:hypothetical protein [Accumulibacter sp.]